ncbi:MAG: tryptophan-rich sensory protein [Cyanobacteria bacterium P01_D01_bin.56]
MVRSWMVIGGLTFAIALLANVVRPADVKWFRRLERPRWLTFEALIPLVWTVVFICGGWSAYIIWERSQSWGIMVGYIVLELLIVAYTPATLWSRSLKLGAYLGAAGTVLGLALAIGVAQLSGWAAVLLIPYLLWSPTGTWITWRMHRMNLNKKEST